MVRAARTALVLYLAGIAAITLGQRPDGLFDTGLRTVLDLTGGALSPAAVEAGANVALFVPLGFLLCRACPAVPGWLLWAACVAASAAVELYQWIGPARDATLRDVVMNSLGAALGVALDLAVSRLRPDRTARGTAD